MKNNKGFTAVEYMIVFAIVLLLFAIAIPNFYRARDTIKAEDLDMTLQEYTVMMRKEARAKAKIARDKRVAERLDEKARKANPELYKLLTSDFKAECKDY